VKAPPPLKAAPLLGDWISVSSAGRVELLSGRVEIGQGALTAIRAMAAAELGCSTETLTIPPARTDRMPDEGVTAGSMSVSHGGMAMRWVASALREQLLRAAAARLDCDRAELELREGLVLRTGQPAGLGIASLVPEIDFARPVIVDAMPFSPEDRPKIRPVRIGIRELLAGTPFVHDLSPPNLLYGRALHPPSMTSELGEFDLDGLRQRPGVVKVLRDGSFVGVIAESEYEAVCAIRWARRRARWIDTAVAPNDVLEALEAATGPAENVFRSGDPDAVEGESFEAQVSRPCLFHGSIGPSAALAEWRDGQLTVHSHSQGIFNLRTALAMVFGLEEERIVVIHCPGAGCYGHNGADDAALDASLLARAVPGHPVRVVWGREDEFRHAPMGSAMVTSVRAQVNSAGRILSMQIEVTSAPHANRPTFNGAPNLRAAAYLSRPVPSAPPTDVSLARGGGADRNAVPLYDIPNVRVSKRIVDTLPFRTSSLRSLGAYTNVYAIETLMERIAAERGEDPVAFRLRHLRDERACSVIRAVAEDTAKSRKDSMATDGVGWGLGFAHYKNVSGYCAVAAQVEVAEDVRVTHLHAVADIGETIDPDGAINQIEGAMVQAASWTLKESVSFEGARVAAESWSDYPILRFSELPETSVRLIDRPYDPPLGCGEIAQGPTAAALGNAVSTALGVPVPRVPLTRDTILRAVLRAE